MKTKKMAICYKCSQKLSLGFSLRPSIEVPPELPKKCEFCNRANRDLRWFDIGRKGR